VPHIQQVLDGHRPFIVIDIRDLLVREQVQHRMIGAFEQTFPDAWASSPRVGNFMKRHPGRHHRTLVERTNRRPRHQLNCPYCDDWAGGFLDAVALRPDAWTPLMEDERAGTLMMPLLLLNGDFEFGDTVADEDAFLAEVPDMIPICIAGIHQFWKSRSYGPAVRAGRSRRKKGGGRRR
jgi:hypothetical protein